MRDRDPRRTARRAARQRERERLGVAVPPCVLCIEEHHTAGRHHDAKLTAPLCERHHRGIHEEMLKAGIPLSFEPNPIKRVANALRAVALYDRRKADAMEHWADLIDPSKGEYR